MKILVPKTYCHCITEKVHFLGKILSCFLAGTKLISFPIENSDSNDTNTRGTRKEWIMNPNGKSYICILHEYVQHALKMQPTYRFTELGM